MAQTVDASGNLTTRGNRVVVSGNGFDFAALAAQWQSRGGGGSAASSTPVVPLWRHRPKHIENASSDTSIGSRQRQLEADSSFAQALQDQTVDADQAGEHFLDMDEKEREEFKKLAVSAGMVGPDATPEQVATAWRQAASRALAYNSGRQASQWISPWEAVEKLGVQALAQEGARFNGYSGYVGDVDQTKKSVQTFSTSDVAGDAEQILRATLGRGPTKAELQKYADAVNAAAKANPLVEHTTGTIDAGGNSNTTTTRTGGVDPNQVMLDVARQDPEFAPVQAATTFFEAAMRALNAPV